MKRDPIVEVIKTEFERKKQRNGSFSLRAFSKQLGLDPSNLSKIMSYRKEVGPQLKAKLALKIGLSHSELQNLDHVATKTHDGAYALHPIEIFKLVSDWQSYVILEMYKLKSFKVTHASVAKRLGLPLHLVKASFSRLEKAGLLKRDASNSFKPADDSSSSILTTASSRAHRDQQRQILEGAIEALETTPIEFRSQSSMTFAVNTKKLEEARNLIKKFRREMGRLLSDSENLDEVYQLSVSLYPASQKFQTLNTEHKNQEK